MIHEFVYEAVLCTLCKLSAIMFSFNVCRTVSYLIETFFLETAPVLQWVYSDLVDNRYVIKIPILKKTAL